MPASRGVDIATLADVEHARHMEYLRSETAAVAGLLGGVPPGGLAARVPACPGWTVADVAGHLLQVHRWAEACVRTGERAPWDAGELDLQDPSGSYQTAAASMIDVLSSTDPMRPTWTLGPSPKVAAFWARRQVHETAMHRLDLAAAWEQPASIGMELALDGIDEALEVFLPRQVARGRQEPLRHAVRLALHDVPTMPLRALYGDGSGPPPTTYEATVSGSAEAVLLALWGRIDLTDPRLVVDGDEAAARAVFASNLTP